MKRLIAILFLPMIFSCEKTIKYEIPELPPSFSVDGRIMTDDTVKVFVGRTEYSLSSDNPEIVSDARVRLIENGQNEIELQWVRQSSGSGYYQTSYLPKANNSYRIEVENNELGLASGEATALSPIDITSYEIDSTRLTFSVSFKDPSGSEDFYAIKAFVRTQSFEYPIFLGTTDPSVDFFYDFQDELLGDNVKYGYTAFLSDESFDGRVKTVDFTEFAAFINPGSVSEDIVLELIRISEDYYKHERSKGGQYTGGDNPFAEPVQIYSNISNGFGIVAAGASTREIIEF
jgi:hypothetical protein